MSTAASNSVEAGDTTPSISIPLMMFPKLSMIVLGAVMGIIGADSAISLMVWGDDSEGRGENILTGVLSTVPI